MTKQKPKPITAKAAKKVRGSRGNGTTPSATPSASGFSTSDYYALEADEREKASADLRNKLAR